VSNCYGKEKRTSRDSLSDGGPAQHGAARRAVAWGAHRRSARRVQDPGAPLHRSRRWPRTDHLLVGEALAGGNHLPRSTSALGIRDSEALVRKSYPEDRPCAAGIVLCDHPRCSSAHEEGPRHHPTNGLAQQEPSDLLRCFGAGTQGIMEANDFLRVALSNRDGKSPEGLRRTANRGALLCSLMAKVQLSEGA
jgi:hypothetical protein